MKKMKKLLSILLCLCMLLQNVPVVAFAAAEGNLCEHHSEHTDDCGYVPEAAEIVCTHEHTEECLSTTVDCTHTHGNDGCTYVPGQEAVYCGHVCSTELCGYVAASEGTSCSCVPDEDGTLTHAEGCGFVPDNAGTPCGFLHEDCGCAAAVEPTGECGHVCSMESGCEKKFYTCGHNEDGSCCFVAAVVGSACGYECAECAGEVEKTCNCGTDDENIHATTCPIYVAPEDPVSLCAHENNEEGCEICVVEIQAMLDALPDMEAITGDNRGDVISQLEAIDSRKWKLSDEVRNTLDFEKYADAAFVLSAPEGFFGFVLGKAYAADAAETPRADFAFLDAAGEPVTAYTPEGAAVASVSPVPNGKAVRGYLPAGTYTVQETVDGSWKMTLTVNGEADADATFTGQSGRAYILLAGNARHEYITIEEMENGTVAADKDYAAENETVTLTVTPAVGYLLDTLIVNGGAVEVTKVDDTTCSFTMPAEDVTVSATFVVCPHGIYESGICTDCGTVCPHETYEEGECTVCGEVCPHTSVDKTSFTCTTCGMTCEHDFGSDTTCDICSYICSHEDADSDAFCDICGWAHWKNVWYPVEDGSKGILITSDTVSTYYQCVDGCAVYDAATASLTLHNYVCEVDSDDAVIEFEDSIKIILEGTNSLTNNNYDGYGILNEFQTEVITISGGGSLTIRSENIGIEAENVSIEGGNVSIYAYEEGIFAPKDSGDVEISGGVVTIESDNGHGIYTEGDIAITGGKVTITADSNGLYAKGDDGIQITDATLKIAADKKGIFSTAENGEGIVISNVKLTVSANDHAIYTEKDKNGIIISDSEITVKTYDSAIRTKGDESDIQITDSRIEITNGFYGIYAYDSDSDVTISGGEILCNADSLIKGRYTLQNGTFQTMQEDKMLEVVSNAYLILEEGTTLINYGQIENEGSLVNEGTIITHCTDENSYPGTVERILHIFNTIKWDSENHWYECANGHKKPDSTEVHTDEICDVCGAMDLSRLEISVEGTYTYNGGTHTPVLKTGDTALTEGVDYTAAYPEDMTSAGEKRITVTGMGRCYGSNVLSFTITPATPTIAWENTTATVTYTGMIAVITEPVVTLVNGETYKGEISYAYTGTSGDEEVSGTGLPINAGTYEITAGIAGQGNYTAATSANKLMLTIAPAPAPVITFPTVLNEITYGQPIEDAKLSFYTNAYGRFQWTAPNAISAAGTGDCALDFYPEDRNNYDWESCDWNSHGATWIESRSALCTTGTVVVNRAPSEIETAPTAKNLTYTGQPQELVTAGSTNDGTMVYSLSKNGTYSETIPTGTSARAYTVYYKVIGDENHFDSDVKSVTVTIGKAVLTDVRKPVVTAPEALAVPQTKLEKGANYSAPLFWDPAVDVFDYDTAYTASISLTPSFNYVFDKEVAQQIRSAMEAEGWTVFGNEKSMSMQKTFAPTRKPILTVTAVDQTVTYGEVIDGTRYTFDCELPGMTAEAELTASTDQATDNGQILISGVVVTDAEGKDITNTLTIRTNPGNLTVTKRPATITAKDQTISYGAEISSTEITSVGLLDGHSAAVTLTPSTTMLTENGTITASNAVIKANGADVTANYEISYEDGKLVIEFDTSVIDALDPETVNSDSQSYLEEVLETIEELLEEKLTEEQKKTLADAKADAEALLGVIEAAQAALDTENTEKVENVTADNVKPEDKAALEDAKADLEKALTDNSGNYTDKEKQDIRDEIQRIEDAVTALENAKAVEEVIKDLPETVEPDDEDDVAEIEAAKKVYEELTTHEKSLVDKELREKLEALLEDAYDYDIIKGDDGKWTKGSSSGLSFTANGPFSKFIGIEVDGKEVDEKYYEAKSGSTIITLKRSFLKKLSTGKHTITVLYTDGETFGTFKIHSESDIPATGDEFNVTLHSTMLAVSISGLIMLILASKKRKRTD